MTEGRGHWIASVGREEPASESKFSILLPGRQA